MTDWKQYRRRGFVEARPCGGTSNKYHIYHHNDADGRAACSVVLHWIEKSGGGNDIVIKEIDYKDSPCFDGVGSKDTVVIVDFSFNPDAMSKLQKKTRNIIWCDHHKTAMSYNYDVDGVRDFSDHGMAGCEVTWKHFFKDKEIPFWLHLLGDYDAWRLQEKNCFSFYEGLKLYNQGQDENGVWRKLFREGDSLVSEIAARGDTVIIYRDNYCQEMRDSFGYETELDGVKAYACNIYKFGSQGFGKMMNTFPVCISYAHNGKVFTVSLYSTTVDVGEIAKRHGGGGHRGASGFICTVLPFVPIN